MKDNINNLNLQFRKKEILVKSEEKTYKKRRNYLIFASCEIQFWLKGIFPLKVKWSVPKYVFYVIMHILMPFYQLNNQS